MEPTAPDDAWRTLPGLPSCGATFPVLPLTDGVVDRYGAVRAELHGRGISKSDVDLLIGCAALEQGAVLVTSDGALLDGTIQGLRAENWLG